MNTRTLISSLTLLFVVPGLIVLAVWAALAQTSAQAHHDPSAHSGSHDCMVDDYVATTYFLQLVEGGARGDADEIAAANGGQVAFAHPPVSGKPAFVLEFPCPHKDPQMLPAAMDALIAAVESDPRVDLFIPSSHSDHGPGHPGLSTHQDPYDCMVDDYIATSYHLQLVEGSTRDDAMEIGGKNGGKVVDVLDLSATQPGFVLDFPCQDDDPTMLPEKMELLIARVEAGKRAVHLIPDSVTYNVLR